MNFIYQDNLYCVRCCLIFVFMLSFHSITVVQDKLMTVASDSSSSGSSGNWLFKNKEHGKTSAAASLVWVSY